MVHIEGNLKVNDTSDEKQQKDVFNNRLGNFSKIFPEIKKSLDIHLIDMTMPEGITFFPILTWQQVANTYEDAVNLILDMIKDSRNGRFQSIFGQNFSAPYLWKERYFAKNIDLLCRQQRGCIIKILSAQTDGRYQGISADQLRNHISNYEFDLDIFTVGLMILLDEDLISDYRDTGIVCSGNRYSEKGDGEYKKVPVFRMDAAGDLVLDIVSRDKTSEFFSSATGFVLKQV